MRKVLDKHCLRIVLLAFVVVLHLYGFKPLRAQNFERMSDIESETYGEKAYVSGDYSTMKNVRRFWVNETQKLKSNRQLEFALTGSNEAVLKVTIPARLLFSQGDTVLVSSAENQLRPLLPLLKGPEAVATVIVASFSDNNGSDNYLNKFSTSRASAIHRWLAKQGVGPTYIHSYGFGNKVPRNQNANIRERERNRRISLYLVPNKSLLRDAKKGKI